VQWHLVGIHLLVVAHYYLSMSRNATDHTFACRYMLIVT
jgi:hypothetical protein